MSWGSAEGGGGSAGVAGGAGGSMGSSIGSGVLQSKAGVAPPISGEIMGGGGGVTANAASQAAGNVPWYQTVASAVKDYSSGERMGLGGAIDAAKDGKYMQTAGYVGNKIQAAGAGAGNPTPLIQLPSGQPQDNSMQGRYAQLYQMFNRR